MSAQSDAKIKGPRIVLRAIESEDVGNIFRGLSHPKVIQHYGVGYSSLEETEEQMKWFAQPEQMWFAVCSIEGEFYGAGGFNAISKPKETAEIGFWLLPEYWGMGIMNEAMPLLCAFGFEELGLKRIEGYVETDNMNCQRAMAKLDFEKEKTLLDHEVKNGRSISVDVFINSRP
ncbi:GNAT family N-acetyltransferase [Cryomorphaceae bacterium]|nr:GNAT family N-acetyltransferase [Cryomorphaceae bacterium]